MSQPQTQARTSPAVELKDFAAEYQVKTDANGRRRLIGYASTFGNVDEVGDRVEAGAFQKTLVEGVTRLPYLWSHDTAEPIGKIDRWSTDAKGLLTEAIMARHQKAEDVVCMVEDGILGGQSIGYQAVKAAWEGATRVLREIKLFEISAVALPANTQAIFTAVKAAGLKAIPGSFEYLAAKVGEAIRKAGVLGPHIWVSDTFADHVVATSWDDDWESCRTWEVTYSFGPDGAVVIGSVAEVEKVEQVVPKGLPDVGAWAELMRELRDGDPQELKVGRRFSAATLEKIRAALTALQDLNAAAEPDEGEPEGDEPKHHSALLTVTARLAKARLVASSNRVRLVGAAS